MIPENMSKEQLNDSIKTLLFQSNRLKENVFYIEYLKIKPVFFLQKAI